MNEKLNIAIDKNKPRKALNNETNEGLIYIFFLIFT